MNARPRAGNSGTPAGSGEAASVAEIEASLQKTMRMGWERACTALHDVIQKVNPSDIPELLAFGEKLPSRNYRVQIRTLLLGRWAETDVTAAMTYAEAVAGFENRQQAILTVLQSWAGKDPKAATAWAQQLPAAQLRQQALSTANYALAQKDSEAAYALLADESRGGRRWDMTHQVFSAWAASDPATAAAKAAQLPSGQ
jgi:hypothetical protein